jgi:hypothetical protein
VLQICDGLPPNLTGLCFNYLLPADHIARNCTRETACLRYRKSGHHARDCPQGQAPVVGGQVRCQPRGVGMHDAAPVGDGQQRRELRGACFDTASARATSGRCELPVSVDSMAAPMHGRRELPASVDSVVAPMRGRPLALVWEPPLRHGDVHVRLGPLGYQQPPLPWCAGA